MSPGKALPVGREESREDAYRLERVRALAPSYCSRVAPNTRSRSWDFWMTASVLQSSSSAALDKLIRHPSFRPVERGVKGDPHGGRGFRSTSHRRFDGGGDARSG